MPITVAYSRSVGRREGPAPEVTAHDRVLARQLQAKFGSEGAAKRLKCHRSTFNRLFDARDPITHSALVPVLRQVARELGLDAPMTELERELLTLFRQSYEVWPDEALAILAEAREVTATILENAQKAQEVDRERSALKAKVQSTDGDAPRKRRSGRDGRA